MSSSCCRIGSQLPLSGDWANATPSASIRAQRTPDTIRLRTPMPPLLPAPAPKVYVSDSVTLCAMTIKRVGPLSCAKTGAALNGVIGLLAGILFSLAAMFGAFAGGDGPSGMFGAIFGTWGIVILPIFCACLGFVMTLIMAVIYNALASVVGGVEVDIQ